LEKINKIGVLGGIGPEATGEFYLKLIHKLQSVNLIKNNMDFPQIAINSINAPELIFNNISDDKLIPYINGLKELEKFGVDFIIMVCNTIHLYYECLQSKISCDIIDIRSELKNKLIKNNKKKITIIGTPSTINKGLYYFDEFEYLNPNREEIKALSNAIFEFNKGVNKGKQIRICENICKKYLKLGSDVIVLACTEFGVMLGGCNFPLINTIDVMVDSVIERFIDLRNNLFVIEKK